MFDMFAAACNIPKRVPRGRRNSLMIPSDIGQQQFFNNIQKHALPKGPSDSDSSFQTPPKAKHSSFIDQSPKTGSSSGDRSVRPPRNPSRNVVTVSVTEHQSSMVSTGMTKKKRPTNAEAVTAKGTPPTLLRTPSMASTRASSMDGRRYAKNVLQTPPLDLKRLKSSSNANSRAGSQERADPLLVKNKQVEMKHKLAQDIIELINKNERILSESDTRLNAYLNKSMSCSPANCLTLVSHLKQQWVDRLKNLGQIFELIECRREGMNPQALLETVYQTPRSLSESLTEGI